jgi:cell division control protein 12
MAPSATSSPGIGIANLPNQRHKIVTQRGANFTLMVCGEYHLLFFRQVQFSYP